MHFSSDIQPLGHATTSLSSSTNTSGSTVASRKSSSSSGYGFLPLFPLPPLLPLVTSTSISPPSSADEWEISPLVPSKPFDAKKTLCSLVSEPRKRQRSAISSPRSLSKRFVDGRMIRTHGQRRSMA
ncbi:hypothetical protein BDN71DRAFT_900638 [Pleurotus eryngii]|uniref:Uncharacterized protein n=1 Tax=Pleurotus eryngii TaxID=5323 RepID=A0A9P5ZFF7_PLEER|nr:hypothetical protein BDN71DRAFT_900638 [Pleurotus eryngii]